MDIQEALEYLNRFQFHGFRLGLERMHAILAAMGHPESTYPVIHVAGTNGKGSSCAMIESILSAAGYRTGLYSSPHLYRLNERFRVQGRDISDTQLASVLTAIRQLIESGYEMSYFEYTTAAAMEWFRQEEVDIAVLETGLGGRLDATNVVTPLVSVITNVTLEHQAYLGNTVEEIAFEKAGIVKEGRPVVCGQSQGPALTVIRERCRQLKAPLRVLGLDFSLERHGQHLVWRGWDGRVIDGICLGLDGPHQVSNAALSIAAVTLLADDGFLVRDDHIRQGCSSVAWPGRGELFHMDGSDILIDGAHNIAGIKALSDLLHGMGIDGRGGKKGDVLLWACSDEGGDKNFAGMLRSLSSLFRYVIVTEPPGPRKPVTVQAWQDVWTDDMSGDNGYLIEGQWVRAFDAAMERCPKGGLVCVAGSLYLVGSVRAEIMSRLSLPGHT